MRQFKKVKIGLKQVIISTLETFWAIGTSIVAGDILNKHSHETNKL